jgi:hypothetical protein
VTVWCLPASQKQKTKNIFGRKNKNRTSQPTKPTNQTNQPTTHSLPIQQQTFIGVAPFLIQTTINNPNFNTILNIFTDHTNN